MFLIQPYRQIQPKARAMVPYIAAASAM
jgi:hypothetical protein